MTALHHRAPWYIGVGGIALAVISGIKAVHPENSYTYVERQGKFDREYEAVLMGLGLGWKSLKGSVCEVAWVVHKAKEGWITQGNRSRR